MWIYLENIKLDFWCVIVSVYGPTNPSDRETKNNFWFTLNKAHKQVKRLFLTAENLYGGDFRF